MTKNERIDFLQERLIQHEREIDHLRERILQLEKHIPHKTPIGHQHPLRQESALI